MIVMLEPDTTSADHGARRGTGLRQASALLVDEALLLFLALSVCSACTLRLKPSLSTKAGCARRSRRRAPIRRMSSVTQKRAVRWAALAADAGAACATRACTAGAEGCGALTALAVAISTSRKR
ncbi:MAG: hypothetical protein U0610_24595 [bacterium]